MNRLVASFLLACTIVMVGLVGNGNAEMEFDVRQTIPLAKKAVDIATSGDGKYLYVLLEGGVVDVYDQSGQRQESLQIGGAIDKIAASPDGSILFLTDSAANTVKIAEVSYLASIDTVGSPYKGKADAPVVIVVYSDFQ